MTDVYQQSYYHVVWATKRREEMVLPRSEALLFSYIRQKCAEKGAFVYALGGLPDHVHLLCSIPATLAVSDFVKLIKGSSSHYINRHPQAGPVRWQRGYSYHTFSKRDLADTMAYVRDQKKRHAEGRLWPALERVPDDDGAAGTGTGSAGLLVSENRSAVEDYFAAACRGAACRALSVLSLVAERLSFKSRPAFPMPVPHHRTAVLALPLALAPLLLAFMSLPARPAPAADLAVTLLSAGPSVLQVQGADGRPFAVRVTPATWVLQRGQVAAPRDLTPGEALRLRLRHVRAGDLALLVCDAETAAALDAHRRRALSGTVLSAAGLVWTVQPTDEDAPVPVLLTARTLFRAGGLPVGASAFGAGASVSVATRGLANGLLAAVSVSDALPAPPGEPGADGPAPHPASVSGTVTESRPDLGLLTFTDAAGAAQTIAVLAATRLKVMGRPASQADLTPGMRVRVRLGAGRDAAGNPVATSVSASAPKPTARKKGLPAP